MQRCREYIRCREKIRCFSLTGSVLSFCHVPSSVFDPGVCEGSGGDGS